MEQAIYQKIEQLKKDADQQGIFAKTTGVARELGKTSTRKYGNEHDYTDEDIEINFDDYGNNVFVNYKGVHVFTAQLGRTISYRPDVSGWIEKITHLYETKVVPIVEVRKKTRARAEALRVFQEWGIKA